MKRVIVFFKSVPANKCKVLFAPKLTRANERMVKKYAGEEYIIPHGRMLVFRSSYHHIVTNMSDNTFASLGVFLTHPTVYMTLLDAIDMLVGRKQNMAWCACVMYTVYMELKGAIEEEYHLINAECLRLTMILRGLIKCSVGMVKEMKRHCPLLVIKDMTALIQGFVGS